MAELEGVGDAVTGGMLGRAVEPRTGERDDGHTHEKFCLNCGCTLVGDYCHCCGQRGHVHRTIAAWWHDFVHSVLHLDGKFWRTLPMLAWRPGELTRRYAYGERAKFISPLALFLFTVFTMFAVFSIAGPDIGSDFGLNQSVDQALIEEREKLQALQAKRQGADPAAAAEVDSQIAEVRSDLARLDRIREEGVTRAIIEDGDQAQVQGSVAWLEAAYEKAKQNPELLLYKMQANAYKFSWALIPISVPFVWILFLHRRRYRRQFTAYDHLVFVTYSIAFMSLALIAFVLTGAIGLDHALLDLAFLLIPPVHMYRQLKGAYGLSRRSALWRAFALLIFGCLALGLFVLLLLALGALA